MQRRQHATCGDCLSLGGASLPASVAATSPVERRRCPRFPTRMPITLIISSEGRAAAHDAATIDFSDLGARIRTTVSLTTGEPVGIIAWKRKRDTVPCRVVWVGASETDGSREAGLEFLSRFGA